MAKLLITTLVGPDDPTRASLGFHMAVNGAVKNQKGKFEDIEAFVLEGLAR